MSAETRAFRYGDHDVAYLLERRERKTLAISVVPGGAIEVTAPLGEAVERIEAVMRRRMPWIRRQQADLSTHVTSHPPRQFLSGETHWYRGRQYRLKVELGVAAGVKLVRGRLIVTTHSVRDADRNRALLDAWRRHRAKVVFAERLEAVLPSFGSADEVRPVSTTIRQLSKRWGSMTPDGRLTLNLDLINAPTMAIDYVLTHELCHRLEHHHGRAFWKLLENKMPDWEERKHRLEQTVRYPSVPANGR